MQNLGLLTYNLLLFINIHILINIILSCYRGKTDLNAPKRKLTSGNTAGQSATCRARLRAAGVVGDSPTVMWLK